MPELEPDEDPFNVAFRLLMLLAGSARGLSKSRISVYYFLLCQPKYLQALSMDAAKRKPARSRSRQRPETFSERYASLRPWRQLYEDSLAILASRGLVDWRSESGSFLFGATENGRKVVEDLGDSVWVPVITRAQMVSQLLDGQDDLEVKSTIGRLFPELLGGKAVD